MFILTLTLAFDFEYPVISKGPTYHSGAVSIGLKRGCGVRIYRSGGFEIGKVPLEVEVDENDLLSSVFFFRMPYLHLTLPIIFIQWWVWCGDDI